jgi:hypothetical protein
MSNTRNFDFCEAALGANIMSKTIVSILVGKGEREDVPA